jgi:hydroxyacyl-ACP dehydratase HTD2-like protein with hotdog domain
MNKQIYFEDITDGQEIPPLEKPVNVINIMMYCSTVWLTDRIHYDYPFATQGRGLPGVVVPGNMAVDWYCQLVLDWIGEKGELRKLSTQYRQFMVAGDTITCGGTVTAKYIKDGQAYVECELHMKNQKGELCVPGKTTIELPIRSK